jgi:hypothetical protein
MIKTQRILFDIETTIKITCDFAVADIPCRNVKLWLSQDPQISEECWCQINPFLVGKKPWPGSRRLTDSARTGALGK